MKVEAGAHTADAKVVNEKILEPFELAGSSNSRASQIELVRKGIHDLFDIVSEASEAVGIDPEQTTPLKLKDKAEGLKKLIEVWQMSCARTAARTTLAFVMSHHKDNEIWQVTKGMATQDDEGRSIDTKAIWQDVAGYACRVADLAYYEE